MDLEQFKKARDVEEGGSGNIVYEQLAKDILTMAKDGGMPDSYWHSDNRIARACYVLNYTPDEACEWAKSHYGWR